MSEILGRPVWRFVIFLGVILATAVLGKILHFIIKNIVHKFAAKTETKFDDMIVEAFGAPFIFFVSIIGFYMGYRYLELTESALKVFSNITEVLIIVGVAWLLMRFLDQLIENYLMPLSAKTKSDLDDHLIPIIRKLVNIFIVIIAGLMILDKFGYNINSILAGLGLGGLAFALAAKDLLANLFGGVAVIPHKYIFSISSASEVRNTDPMLLQLRTLSSTITNGVFSLFLYSSKVKRFNSLFLNFLIFAVYHFTSARLKGMVIHRAPPPPRANSEPAIVTTHFL